MRLKKTFSAALSGVLAACFTFSGLNPVPVTKLFAEDVAAVAGGAADVSGGAVDASGEAVTTDAVVVNGYANPVYDAQTDTADWEYVYFGTYPQTEVTGEELTDAITDAEYDLEGIAVVDGVKYKRLNANGATYAYQFTSDKTVPSTEGEFYTWERRDTYHYFKFEPLKWRVLESSENGQLLLMADQAIDCVDYMPREHKVSWYISYMRSWLNEYDAKSNECLEDFSKGGFLSVAFTEEEENAIVPTMVLTESNELWQSEVSGMIGASVNITDKIYILSAEEATNEAYGFAPAISMPSKTRQMQMTDYAFARGGWAGSSDDLQGNCWWFMRSPGDHERKAVLGYRDGRVYTEGYYANLIPYACMVPVCHVDVQSDAIVKVGDETPEVPEPEEPTGPSVTIPTGGAADVMYGDVDGNNKVELADAQTVLKAALKIVTLDEARVAAADVDANGKVELADAQLVLKYALKIIKEFPADKTPAPAPTTAPTEEPTQTPSAEPTEDTPVVSKEPLVQPVDHATGDIWIAGDSIAADHSPHNEGNSRSTVGWGVIFDRYFTDDVTVHNTALSSRSSKSYIQEPQYQEIMEGMKAGDYLIISFGHNDEFPELKRHTNAYGSSSDEGSYKWYLKNYYIDPALRAGAIPILVSSVVERNFVDGQFYYQFHSVYKTAMEELVQEYAEEGITIPYIDLHSKMQALYEELGEYDTEYLHARYQSKDSNDSLIQVIDNTHFTLAGARYATKYILEGFKANGLDIMKYADADMIATLNSIAAPSRFYFGDLEKWITKPADDDTPVIPDVSGGAVTPDVSGGAVTPDVSGGAVTP